MDTGVSAGVNLDLNLTLHAQINSQGTTGLHVELQTHSEEIGDV